MNQRRLVLPWLYSFCLGLAWTGFVEAQPGVPVDPAAPVEAPDHVVTDDPAAAARIVELEAHVAALQAEIARLRMLLSTRGLDPDAPAPTPDGSDALAGPQPTAARDDARSFRSVVEVVREMPRDITPNAARWDDFDRAAALNWLDANARGHHLDVGLELAAFTLTPNPFQGQAPDQLPWQLSLTFSPRDYRFAQLRLDQVVTVPPVLVSDAHAQRLQRLREGMVLPVRGTIHAVDLQPDAARRLEVRLELVDVTIDAPLFEPPDQTSE